MVFLRRIAGGEIHWPACHRSPELPHSIPPTRDWAETSFRNYRAGYRLPETEQAFTIFRKRVILLSASGRQAPQVCGYPLALVRIRQPAEASADIVDRVFRVRRVGDNAGNSRVREYEFQ